jgi:hypothetical protein
MLCIIIDTYICEILVFLTVSCNHSLGCVIVVVVAWDSKSTLAAGVGRVSYGGFVEVSRVY